MDIRIGQGGRNEGVTVGAGALSGPNNFIHENFTENKTDTLQDNYWELRLVVVVVCSSIHESIQICMLFQSLFALVRFQDYSSREASIAQ